MTFGFPFRNIHIFFGTYFMNSGFINPKKNCVLEKIFQNDFLSSRFYISEISLIYETTMLETSKTAKGNFGIL